MKKFILIILIIQLVRPVADCSLLIAQTPTQEWVKRFSWANYANGLSVKLDGSGNVYVLLKLYTDTTLNDFGIIKYNNSGNLLWSTYYNSYNDFPQAFEVTETGDIYITGFADDSNFITKMITIKVNTNGNLVWAKLYNDGTGSASSDIKIDKLGNIIVSGGVLINDTARALTIKYNPNGDTLWVRLFNQLPDESSISKIALDDSNNVYLCGSYGYYFSYPDYLILKYNSNGILKWYARYDTPQHYQDHAELIALDLNGNIYVTGNTNIPAASFNNILLKLNSNGVILWVKVFTGVLNGNGQCESQPKGLAVSSDGNSIYYTTSCYGNPTLTDIVTLKYTSLGDSVWVRSYNGGVNAAANTPGALKLDKNNDIYITGVANRQTTGDDFVTIKYLPSGTQQWVAMYNGPLTNSFDKAHDLTIDSSLNVYVTGASSRYNGPPYIFWDAVTIKYSQPDGIHQISSNIPKNYTIKQNYPNPFNSQTMIIFEIPKFDEVKIIIYDIIGREVETLVNEELKPGKYVASWNANNFSSGVYFYTMITKTYRETKKAILIK